MTSPLQNVTRYGGPGNTIIIRHGIHLTAHIEIIPNIFVRHDLAFRNPC